MKDSSFLGQPLQFIFSLVAVLLKSITSVFLNQPLNYHRSMLMYFYEMLWFYKFKVRKNIKILL